MLHTTKKSGNRKIGPIAATYRTMDSCPTSCAFYKNGCYASGRIFGIANKFGKDEKTALTELFEGLPENSVVRHHVSGDIVGADGELDATYVSEIRRHAEYRPDIRHIMYTHAWRKMKGDELPFPVNASCETKEDIEQAVAKGLQAVITVRDGAMLGQTVAGKKIIRCPEEYKPGVTCATCKLCSRERGSVVAFTTHGAGKKLAEKAIEGRQDDQES